MYLVRLYAPMPGGPARVDRPSGLGGPAGRPERCSPMFAGCYVLFVVLVSSGFHRFSQIYFFAPGFVALICGAPSLEEYARFTYSENLE